jgi:alpha-mannosidase
MKGSVTGSASEGVTMKKTIVHMIGQAHLDPVWLWPWTEGRAEALATTQSAVDRLGEYPDFQFTRGEAQIYQWVEEENPQLFDRILTLIRQGRWHVVNGMIIQSDMNLPQGESIVRHFLLGKAYMREHLGTEPRVAYCVDSFGHAGTLPQIFKKCGCEAYVFMRPGPHEMELPGQVFWWQAPDGSRVLAFRITMTYATRTVEHQGLIEAAVQAKPPQLDHTMSFFGVGNHGGGPTKEQIEYVQAFNETREDLDVRFSSPQAYFDAITPHADGLPTVAEELYFHAVGCYSANSSLKRSYRQAECGLLVAERMASLAQLWAGWKAPTDRLRELWRDLCFQGFHDILGGCSIKAAADDTIMALGRVKLSAEEITNAAGRAIAARIDTRGPGGTVVLFNPFPYRARPYVEYEAWTDWQDFENENWGLTDDQGHPVPWQRVASQDAFSVPGSHRNINRLIFRADLPPLGYRVYRFAPGLPRTNVNSEARVTPTSLENEHLSLQIDPNTGSIVSCVEKTSGLELVGPGDWNVAQVLEDTSDTWSHGVSRYDHVVGQFGDARVTVDDSGPIQASLLVERAYEGSTWLQQVALRQGETEIFVRNWLFWEGQWGLLKLAFDVAAHEPQSAHDVPFGWVGRPRDGTERPTQMWLDVTGPSIHDADRSVGLSVIDDGKYGCDVTGSRMRLTILRSPPYAYHAPPHEFGVKQRYDWIDQGPQEFTLVLRPHVGDWRNAGTVQRAREINLRIPGITMHCHPGELTPTSSLAALSSSDMELTALKPAEDGDGYILRIADRHGDGGQAELSWLDEVFPISLSPFEVLTLRLTRRTGNWQAVACDMLERPLA